MMNLHEEEGRFKELIYTVAKKLHVRPQLIEKDYWVTFGVKTLFSSKIKNKIVFKGGTSLSKCYCAISRFSEDIDIGLSNYAGDSRAFRKRTMKRVTDALSSVLPQIAMPETRKEEIIRTTCHTYHNVLPSVYLGQVKPYIKLEVTQMGSDEPYEDHMMRSYIGDYLSDTKDYDSLSKYHLEAFPVKALGLARTFAEKISCLLQCCYAPNPYKALGNRIRHIFDLHELLKVNQVKDFLIDPSFGKMLMQVKAEEYKNYRDNNLWLTAHPAHALLFLNPLDMLKKIPAKSKEGFEMMLINGTMPSDQSMVASLEKIYQGLTKIHWHTLAEKKAGWVDRMYRKMDVYVPYDGIFAAVVVAKDFAEIANNKQKNTLYIFPKATKERECHHLLELINRGNVPIKMTAEFANTYPASFAMIKNLLKQY